MTARTSARSENSEVAPQRLLTVEDLAQILSIGPRGARKAIERGEIPSLRLGRRLYVRPEDLEAHLARLVREEQDKRSVDAGRVLRGLSVRRAPDRR